MIRTTPVEFGTSPYDWNSKYKWECTWYTYYRAGEKGLPYPCWWDRATETGSYTHAKDWLKNYRDPWEVKGVDYIPVENDIAVFAGDLGHVAFIEKVEGDRALLSQYKNGDENSFSTYSWKYGTSYTGPLLGYLHCPYGGVEPVSRDNSVDQIQTSDPTLRIRTKPSLNGVIVGHVQMGYYNVLSKTEADNYTWYQISKDRWCADITTKYLPASSEDDFIKKIEEYFNGLKSEINSLSEQRDRYKEANRKAIEILSEADK